MNLKGERIKELRKERGLSQAKLAKECGISRSVIAMVESGKQNGGRDFNKAIANYFGVSIDYLEGMTDDRNNSKESLVNEFVQFLIDNGIIEDENNVDEETEQIILSLIRREVKKIKGDK
jgi:transcriptional regulator with XRE-family HTH domain